MYHLNLFPFSTKTQDQDPRPRPKTIHHHSTKQSSSMAEAQGRPSKESLLTENNEPHEKILSKSHRISILCVASVVIVGISIFIFAIHFPHNRKRLRESTSQSTSTSAASSESSSFDFYIMAMSWQPQFCYSNRNYNHVGCTEPNDYWKSHWTIHGLWPQFSDGSYPSSCSSQQLESSDFQYLSEDLNLYWPNVKSSADTSANSYTHSSFWRHEWSKHGTCTGMSPSLYLQTALKLQVATPDIVGQAYEIGRAHV